MDRGNKLLGIRRLNLLERTNYESNLQELIEL